jgi:hypothetical protein
MNLSGASPGASKAKIPPCGANGGYGISEELNPFGSLNF